MRPFSAFSVFSVLSAILTKFKTFDRLNKVFGMKLCFFGQQPSIITFSAQQTSSYSRSTFILIVLLWRPCILHWTSLPPLIRPNSKQITLLRGLPCLVAQSRLNVLQQNKSKTIMKLIIGKCWICCRSEVPSPIGIRKPNPYENMLLCLESAIYQTKLL